MELTIEYRTTRPDEVHVVLSGRFTAEWIPAIDDQLAEAALGGRRVIVDLRGVALVDRAAAHYLASLNGPLELTGAPAAVARRISREEER